jgi:hypothetical protein
MGKPSLFVKRSSESELPLVVSKIGHLSYFNESSLKKKEMGRISKDKLVSIISSSWQG